MLDEGADAALVLEAVFLAGAFVREDYLYPGIQKRQFAQAFGQDVVAEKGVGKDDRAGVKTDISTGLAGVADDAERLLRHAEVILLVVNLAAAADGQLEDI